MGAGRLLVEAGAVLGGRVVLDAFDGLADVAIHDFVAAGHENDLGRAVDRACPNFRR